MKTAPPGTRTVRQWFNLLVIACILPAAAAAILLLYHSYQRERASVERSTIATARALMQAVDRELASAQGALQVLATSPLLAEGDLAGFYRQAQEALHYRPGINILLSDRHGRQLLNTLRPFGAALPPHGNPAQLQRLFDTGQPIVSDLYYGMVAQRPLISIDVPVRRGNRIVYDLSMAVVPEQLDEILRRQQLPQSWPVAIFDSAGVIVARTRESERFVGQQGIPSLLQRMREVPEDAVEAVTLEGIAAIVAFSRSSVSNWAVAIGVPRRTLTAELWASVSSVIAGAVLLLISGLLLARFIGGKVTRSVQALVEPAMALGYGKPIVVPPLQLHEANDVGQALQRAAQLLQARTAERDRAEQAQQQIRQIQQQLERSEALQRAIFEQAPDAILLVALSGAIVRANAEAERVFGYTPAQLQRMTVEELLPEEARQRHAALRASFFAAPQRRPMGSGMCLSGRRADGARFPVDVMLSPLHANEEQLVIATVRDVTEQRRNEEALRESEKRFRNTLEHAPIGMSLVSLDGRWLEVNNAMCELVGYRRDELLKRRIQEITHPDDVERDVTCAAQLLQGDVRVYQLEKRYIHKDGHIVPVLLTRSLLRDDQGRPLHFITQIEDISARKRAQERLTALNNRLALATQAGGIAVWELDLRTRIFWWDKRMYELYQVQPEQDVTSELWWQRIHPDHQERVRREFDAAVGGGAFAIEFPMVWPDGQQRIVRAKALLSRDAAGQPLSLTGVCWDVTESRQREEAIRIALREKETLLKELYHRVKNNLQVISSLFNLQLHALPPGVAREALRDGANRVRAMALVHEKLYQSGNLSSIALDDYIASLCAQLGNASGAEQRGIQMAIQAERIEVGLEIAVPLGLLLNELISNSLKHAFPQGRAGRIVVRLARQSEDAVHLLVSDDGIGFPVESCLTSSHSLGLKLVGALAAQLDGKLDLRAEAGTRASLVWRLARHPEGGLRLASGAS